MNWKEKLHKECEPAKKENEFYSFSVMQMQQDKEYFRRFGRQELAIKYEETRKLYKHFRDYLPHYFLLVIAGFMLTHFAWSSFHIFIIKSFWEAVEFYAMNILAIGTNIYVVRAAVLQVSRVRLFRRRLRVIEELMQSNECAGGKTL